MATSGSRHRSHGLTRREFGRKAARMGLGLAGATVLGTAAPRAGRAQAPKGPVTLEFWEIAQGVEFDKVMKQVIKEFEESHRNIKVNLSVQPSTQLDARVRPIFTSGGPGPDVLYGGSVATLTYARMPFGFIDITDRVKAAGLRSKTPEGVWITVTEKGRDFGVPLVAFPFMLHYNKDLYASAGIAGPPETLDDLLRAVKRITDPAKDRFGFLVFTSFPAWILEQLWYNGGVGYFDGSEDFRQFDVTRPVTINKPEAVAALEFVRSLAETAPGGLQGNINVKTTEADAAFARGNLGHFYTHTIHTSQIPSFNSKMVPLKNFDIAVFPRGAKRRGMMFSTESLGIAKQSKDPDAAWEFIKFLSDAEGRLAPSIGTVPVRQDVKVDDKQVGSWLVPPGRKALAGEIFPQAFFPQVGAIAAALKANMEAYFLEKKTAKQALDDAAAEARKIVSS